eukprot:50199_1
MTLFSLAGSGARDSFSISISPNFRRVHDVRCRHDHDDDDTPYEGGVFDVKFTLPPEYPHKPPIVFFQTKVWHPNVSHDTGEVCDFTDRWQSDSTLVDICTMILAFLIKHDKARVIDLEVGSARTMNPKKCAKTARKWTQRYAQPRAKPTAASGKKQSGDKSPVKLSRSKVAPTSGPMANLSRSRRKKVIRFCDITGAFQESAVKLLKRLQPLSRRSEGVYPTLSRPRDSSPDRNAESFQNFSDEIDLSDSEPETPRPVRKKSESDDGPSLPCRRTSRRSWRRFVCRALVSRWSVGDIQGRTAFWTENMTDVAQLIIEVLLRPDRPKTNKSSRPPVIMRMLFSINYDFLLNILRCTICLL